MHVWMILWTKPLREGLTVDITQENMPPLGVKTCGNAIATEDHRGKKPRLTDWSRLHKNTSNKQTHQADNPRTFVHVMPNHHVFLQHTPRIQGFQ